MLCSHISIILTCLTSLYMYAASSADDYFQYIPSHITEHFIGVPIDQQFFSFFDSLTVVRSRSESTSYTDPHTFVACIGIGTHTGKIILDDDQCDDIIETTKARNHLPIQLYPDRVAKAIAGLYKSAVFHWYVSTGIRCAWRWHKSLSLVEDQELKPNDVSKLMASFGIIVPHELLPIAETVYAEHPGIFNQESIPTLLQALQCHGNGACHTQQAKHWQKIPVLVTNAQELTRPILAFFPHLREMPSKQQFDGIAKLFDDADDIDETDDGSSDELCDDESTKYYIQEHFVDPLEDSLSSSDSCSANVSGLFNVDTNDY